MMWFSVMCRICSVFVTVQLLYIQLHSIFQDLAASDVYVVLMRQGLCCIHFQVLLIYSTWAGFLYTVESSMVCCMHHDRMEGCALIRGGCALQSEATRLATVWHPDDTVPHLYC